MPVRRSICLLALAAGLLPAAAAGHPLAAKRTFTLSPRPQYVTLPVRIAGSHWPRCGTVRVTVKPATAKKIVFARVKIRANGGFARTWKPTWRMAGLARVTATASCGAGRTVASSSIIRILPTP